MKLVAVQDVTINPAQVTVIERDGRNTCIHLVGGRSVVTNLPYENVVSAIERALQIQGLP